MADIREIAAMETKCTGCGACVNVCPQGAIRLVERNGYFLFPEIDAAKCNHCGLCLKKCPSAGPRPEPSKVTTEVAYGCYVKDEVERARSSSGGVFQALAKHVLKQGGVVCGAKFTRNCECEHVIIDQVGDLPPLQRSKYVQSNPGHVYSDIRNLLLSGRTVLFVGTPCQVSACKAVCGDVRKGVLYTVDLLCAGVPPGRLLREHLEECANRPLSEIRNLRFRDKQHGGWTDSRFRFEWSDGDYDGTYGQDSYLRSFVRFLTIRRSCGDCRFARFPRQGDITIGDLWWVAEAEFHWTDNKGASALIVNTDRGRTLLDGVRNEFAQIKSVSISSLSGWGNPTQTHAYLHPNSLRFYAALQSADRQTKTVDQLMEHYLQKKDGICLLDLHDSHSDYGSVLSAYALSEKIKAIVGCAPIHVHLQDTDGGELAAGNLIDFSREHLPSTALVRTDDDLLKLNDHFQTFIVGSGWVWQGWRRSETVRRFMLYFARMSKNICSYAASFNLGFVDARSVRDETLKHNAGIDLSEQRRLLKRFSHLGVREESGIKLCCDLFDVQAERVLDSVFLLRQAEYEKLIGDEDAFGGGSVQYVLNPEKADEGLVKSVGAEAVSIAPRDRRGVSVGEWLKAIRDCEFFVSDSFYGICLAIVFRKQFAVVQPRTKGCEDCFQSLFKILNIPFDRIIRSIEDYKRVRTRPLDYAVIEPALNDWMAKSEDYLKRILADNGPNKIRDWLESVEMSLDAKRAPAADPFKRGREKLIWTCVEKLRRIGIVSNVRLPTLRRISVLGIPVIQVHVENSLRHICLFGLRVKTIRR